ncbi:DUF2062 domain-containing protein [Pseudogemmobacter faecipullorum]|uniref:DUF2062 domain-containing protein n=1 Tax=Pseudogemmobacter faecipullorum TaxID=2755041 RepID=A0ABS8CGX4_9RHOB|nr:DUF2062 domain-containing protein [Pseudogemmobacter faecipullorum]
MVFKRRDPQTWGARAREMVWPRGGLKRATQYVVHRMRRLPDSPQRVARGIFIGSVIGFLPFPGLQFIVAWIGARLVNGNLLAALLATLNTNPITTPFFAVASMSLGHWILGIEKPLSAEYIGHAFASAGSDLWHNFLAIFTSDTTRWGGLLQFWNEIYLPYFIGALGPAIVLSAVAYYITLVLVSAYQKARASRAREHSEKRRRLREMLADARERIAQRQEAERNSPEVAGDDGPASP